ncbi:vacuolar protein sorting-associated protein 37A isoform X2 [Petromyzon marinus]|uniref:vacuolar protein sorting-associated protein 37A isoform X2 n=1 Tax=Petromyzon marinus TaxID=7757 RepID=UPI003F70F3BB
MSIVDFIPFIAALISLLIVDIVVSPYRDGPSRARTCSHAASRDTNRERALIYLFTSRELGGRGVAASRDAATTRKGPWIPLEAEGLYPRYRRYPGNVTQFSPPRSRRYPRYPGNVTQFPPPRYRGERHQGPRLPSGLPSAMSWWARRQEPAAAAPSVLQSHRQLQIQSLQAAIPGTVEMQKDIVYNVPAVIDNQTLTINVFLPPQFPQDRPVVHVMPYVRHPWLNEKCQVIGSPAINGFVIQSDLGKAVVSVVEEFRTNPPCFGASRAPYSTQPTGFAPPAVTSHPTLTSHSDTTPLGKDTRTQKGVESSDIFAQVAEMSLSELRALSDSDEQLGALVLTHPAVVTFWEETVVQATRNEALAHENLSMKPQLDCRRNEFLQKCEELNRFKSAFDKKVEKQHEMNELLGVSALEARLKVAALQAEEESEASAERFLDGSCSLEDFLPTFMEARTLYHMRKAKEEKLLQLL